MKKLLLLGATLCMMAGFSACSDNGNDGPDSSETLSGFYTINGGNKRGKVPASITSYDFETGKATQNAFFAANDQQVGDGAQMGVIDGDHMYIAMYSSNLIWDVNASTLKINSSIVPEGEEVKSPRYLAVKNGKLYATMYTGYVAEYDKSNGKLLRKVKVGPNPDQFCISGNNLVVACSDGMNSKNGYVNSCISVVDLNKFTETKIQDLKKLLNPTDAASNGTDAFVVCKGDYSKIPSTVVKVEETKEGIVATEVCKGTNIAVCGNELYVIDAPYSKPVNHSAFSFKVYDVKSLKLIRENMVEQTEGTDSWIASPNGLNVDPATGDIVIVSYNLDSAGASMTQGMTYANVYDKTGKFKNRVECGVGARYIVFRHKTIE